MKPATITPERNWFAVDKLGLSQVMGRKGKEFAVFELIQNAWDEKGVTSVKVNLATPANGETILSVEDDSPEGFKDMTHAYTLFANSAKKTDVEKRGRFNLGEKLVLAISSRVTITSTKGTIFFDERGRVEGTDKRAKGTLILCQLPMSPEEHVQIVSNVSRLVPPTGIATTFNGQPLKARVPFRSFEVKIQTELAGTDGILKKADRVTQVNLYGVEEGETASLYEMGIPVVETGDRWHYDVCQKVPLTIDRENVPPGYLKKLRLAVFNHCHDLITNEDANATWVGEAVASPDVDAKAMEAFMTARFGHKRVSFDPTDLEGMKRAVSEGYQVVQGSHLSKGAWANAREKTGLKPAGQVTPGHNHVAIPGAPAMKMLDEVKITPQIKAVMDYAMLVASVIMKAKITVRLPSEATGPFVAMYGPRDNGAGGELFLNVGRLGHNWFDLTNNRVAIDDLLIHEFAHHYSGDHLSSEYYNALSKVGAMFVDGVRKKLL